MWFASLIFLYLSFVINLKLMKKIKILSLFVCLIALLAACEDEDITPSYGARTVLVYIAGNNSLGQSDFDSKDVSEMIEGMKGTEGTTNNLLVYFAGYIELCISVCCPIILIPSLIGFYRRIG